MDTQNRTSTTGLLLSGGLDSAILLVDLLGRQRLVQPIYVRSGLNWEDAEESAARRFLQALESPQVAPLVTIDSPLAGLLGVHWSVAGNQGGSTPVPAADSDDRDVYLPGRNLLLVAPAGLWCQLRGIEELAIGILGTNPFNDGSPEFFLQLEAVLRQSHEQPIRLSQPLRSSAKAELMRQCAELPLELTFSCLKPVGLRHCGRCNKCAERQRAFCESGLVDRTQYEAGRSESRQAIRVLDS